MNRPYSPSVRAGPWLAVSGQTGYDGDTLAPGGFPGEFRQALRNVRRVTEAAGLGLTDIVKVTIFLTDISQLEEANRLYAEFFAGHKPARSTVAVTALPRGAACEIEAWAYSA